MAQWPEAVVPLFKRAITVEYASLTSSGRSIMVPLTPYVGSKGQTLDVSTGLTYPAKAERARRNPRVALLFADRVGSGLSEAPVVLVQGLATVRDADLQANTDRYVESVMSKLPAPFRGTPPFLLRRMSAYFARIWIEVTPVRMWWWTSRALDRPPGEWTAPPGTTAPESDPRPAGAQPKPWLPAPTEWRTTARRAMTLEHADVAWVDSSGWPLSVPGMDIEETSAGFQFRLGTHLPDTPARGPACLTFHTHTPSFTTQENYTFVGEISANEDGFAFHVHRLLNGVRLQGNQLGRTVRFLRQVRALHPRLAHEASRHGQPVPAVRVRRR